MQTQCRRGPVHPLDDEFDAWGAPGIPESTSNRWTWLAGIVPLAAVVALAVMAFSGQQGQAQPQASPEQNGVVQLAAEGNQVTNNPTATSTPVAMPAAAVPGTIHTAYNGTLHDNGRGLSSPMHLTGITQDAHGKLTGQMTVDLTAIGNGPFSGTALASGGLSFTVVTTNNLTMTFVGASDGHGTLSGTVLFNFGGETDDGTWTATPVR